jgi:hypothetical protein
MWHALNLAGHLTSLSGPAIVRNPLLPVGVTSLARDHRGRLGVLSQRRLRSSMTLRRSSRLRPYFRALRFCVMHQRASFSARYRFGLAEDAASLQARLARSLWPTDGSLRGKPADFFCYDEVCRLSPLLRQKCKRRTIGCHTLDGLHNRLDLNGIEVQI